MQRLILLILSQVFIVSCTRYPDPSIKTLESFSFGFINKSGEKYLAGETLNDSVRFFVNNSLTSDADAFKVTFEIIRGEGSVSKVTAQTNSNGIVSTCWQLGNASAQQILRASVYDREDKYLTSANLTEYGFRTNEWDAYTGSPDADITGMVADTVRDFTLMVTNGKLYRQGERYFVWEEVVDPDLVSPRTIEMDRNGVIYVSTWKGEIVKSTDHGESWSYCTKPYFDNPYYIFMSVSNDNYIWVFKFDYPTLYSKDGGQTWITAGSQLFSSGQADIFRLKNGSLLMHGSNCCSLMGSDDEGATWNKIATPGYSTKLYVSENEDIFILTQLNGRSIYRSTDSGLTFQYLYSVNPVFGTTDDNIFNKWDNIYYICIPGYGILKSTDLIHYEDYWVNNNILDLFIDNSGVLMAKQYNSKTVYYRKNTE